MQVIEGTAAAHGCKAELSWSAQAYGPTANNKNMADLVLRAGQGLIDAERVRLLEEPTMAAEDFGFLAGSCSTSHLLTLYGPCLSSVYQTSRQAGRQGITIICLMVRLHVLQEANRQDRT